jgi:hypothetical protein
MPKTNIANSKSRALHKTIINKLLNIILQSIPTYWPTDKNKVPNIIDFEVIKIAKTYFSIKASLELFSDHSPIITNVNNKVVKKMQACVLHNKRTN